MGHMKRLADQEVERIAQEEGLDITDDQVYQELWVRVCEKLIEMNNQALKDRR